jgi:hypothetical protein
MHQEASRSFAPSARTSLVPPPQYLQQIPFDIKRYCPVTQRYLMMMHETSRMFSSAEAQYARTQWFCGHEFRPTADLCIDGRVSDFSEALGLPLGIIEKWRSGGCINNSPTSWIYAERFAKANKKFRSTRLANGTVRQMVQMHFVTTHYSKSRLHTDSCAAWKHDMKSAEAAMLRHANEMNHDYSGYIVAFLTAINTDTDGVTVYGPGGSLNTEDYVECARGMNGNLRELLTSDLQKVFPRDWQPLTALDRLYARAFHAELAEHLAANVRFVCNVIDAQRPIELFTHDEKLIFIGRPSETRDHNTAFYIEDRDRASNAANFEIALMYVTLNTLNRCIKEGSTDLKIPVIISIPHHDEPDMCDQKRIARYALGIRHGEQHQGLGDWQGLESHAERFSPQLRAWLNKHLQGGLPEWASTALDEKNIRNHIDWCVTVNDRSTRMPIPIE